MLHLPLVHLSLTQYTLHYSSDLNDMQCILRHSRLNTPGIDIFPHNDGIRDAVQSAAI